MNVWFYDSEQYLIFCFSWCGYLYLSPCLQRVEIVYITIFWKVSVKKKDGAVVFIENWGGYYMFYQEQISWRTI